MLITVDNQSATRLLRIYGINSPAADERLSAQRGAETGIPATIDGVSDPQFGPSIRLKIAGRRALRACPISETEAESLVAEFHGEQLPAQDPATDRALVQLLLKCSKMYRDSGISEVHLVVYVTPRGYRTHAVYMLRARNPAIRRKRVC